MGRKIYLPGLFPLLAAVCLVAGILSAINRAGYQGVYLDDTEISHNGWEYEIRMNSGEVKQIVPFSETFPCIYRLRRRPGEPLPVVQRYFLGTHRVILQKSVNGKF